MIQRTKPESATSNAKLADKSQPQHTPGTADFPAKKLPPLPPEYERGFLTTSELQKTVLPLSRRSIFDYRRRGIIPSIRVGSKILYHRESVIAALLRRQDGGVAQ
jgi:Helix-turn-helix domain